MTNLIMMINWDDTIDIFFPVPIIPRQREKAVSRSQDTRGARQDEDANRRNGGKTDRPDQARRRGGEEKEKGKR